MKNVFIITGGNKGLGKAFCDALIADEENIVISLSRRLAEDQKLLIDKPLKKFYFIGADLSQMKDSSGLTKLKMFKEEAKRVIFISNAGVVEPIGEVGTVSEGSIVESISVNTLAPFLIINYILQLFEGTQTDIINISSGAANKPINGWAAYCAAKAYMGMFMQVLDNQFENNPLVKIHNISPGVIDTGMQQHIRDADVKGFTRHSEFVALKENGKLQKPAEVASNILKELKLSN